MAISDQITAIVTALKNKFILKSNKVASWSTTTSDDNVPSEKLVKASLDEKIDKSQTAGLVKNDGTIDTNSYLTATDLPTKTSDLTNDGSDSTDSLAFIETSATAGLVKNDGSIDTTTYLSEHQSLSDVGGIVDVEKQATAETGYAATYVIKQGSSSSKSQVGVKINIPKDFLVKSGEVKTAAAADLTTLGAGYTAGDKYIDFVINTKQGDGTDEHMYINVKDLVEDTTYTADEDTLQLVNGEFSVKEIDTTELASGILTSLGYADAFHSSAAASITSTDVNNWNAKSELTTSDVDARIETALSGLATEINAIGNSS